MERVPAPGNVTARAPKTDIATTPDETAENVDETHEAIAGIEQAAPDAGANLQNNGRAPANDVMASQPVAAPSAVETVSGVAGEDYDRCKAYRDFLARNAEKNSGVAAELNASMLAEIQDDSLYCSDPSATP